MRILALDQASRTSGFAIFFEDQLVEYGTFTFNDQDLGDRLKKIRLEITKLIKTYNINYVVFEDIQLQNNVSNNVSTFKVLAEVFGVIQELLSELQIQNTQIVAATWKAGLNIKGKNKPEQKANAFKYVVDKYKITPTQQDAADAICIGTYYIQKQQSEFDWSD